MQTSRRLILKVIALLPMLYFRGFSFAEENYERKIKEIIKHQLGVSEDEVRLDSSFIDDLGADSLDAVELVLAFEDEFNINISDDHAEKIKTVHDAVVYIRKSK